ncbi:MAG: hypothetical protein PVI75_06035 [Gammaproteobacteria bacterium]|jgi:hypothetical protein
MKHKFFSMIIVVALICAFNVCIAKQILLDSQDSQDSQEVQHAANVAPQVAPDVVLTPSNNDLKATNKLFDHADYDHLQVNSESDENAAKYKGLFKIPDIAEAGD